MSEKILVMDEQPAIRDCLADILNHEGYIALTAENIADGLRLFEAEAPDLVIADTKMPIGRCLDLLDGIRGTPLEIDLILLAAADDRDLALGWLGKGVFDFLVKPVQDRGFVVAAVRRALQKRRLIVQISRLNKVLEQCTIKDPLTGLYNHRFMHKCLMDEIVRSTRYGHKFLVILADIDRFKTLNESFGSKFGDFVLTRLARLLEDNLRLTDTTFRFGGGRYLMLLPETGKDQAIRVAERILEGVRFHDFSHDGCKSRVTVSMGSAEFPLEARDVRSLVGLAEQRLQVAKNAGRDCFDFEACEAPISDFSPEN